MFLSTAPPQKKLNKNKQINNNTNFLLGWQRRKWEQGKEVQGIAGSRAGHLDKSPKDTKQQERK